METGSRLSGVPQGWWGILSERFRRGPVAQLGARFHGMEEVKGSNPFRSTKILMARLDWKTQIPLWRPRVIGCNMSGSDFSNFHRL